MAPRNCRTVARCAAVVYFSETYVNARVTKNVCGFKSGSGEYSNLCDIANHMFPSIPHQETLGEFSSLQYWRPPLPDVSIEIEAALAQERGK